MGVHLLCEHKTLISMFKPSSSSATSLDMAKVLPDNVFRMHRQTYATGDAQAGTAMQSASGRRLEAVEELVDGAVRGGVGAAARVGGQLLVHPGLVQQLPPGLPLACQPGKVFIY